MKKLTLGCYIALTFLLLNSNLLLAGEKVDKELEVGNSGEIEIRNNRGKIEVKGWDENRISVKGELDDLTEKFIFKTSGDKTLIKVKLPERSRSSLSGKGSNLKIMVPKSFGVHFGGVATDLDISNIESSVDISSVSGDVNAKSINAKLHINSVSGKIKLQDVNGTMQVSTVSGDLDAKVSSQKILVSGVSSDISIRSEDIETAQISNVSGNSKLSGSLADDGIIKMSTVSGDSYYTAQTDLNARILLDTGPGGDVVNKFSEDKPTRSFIGSEKLKITLGNGKGEIRMSTVSGEIGILKSK